MSREIAGRVWVPACAGMTRFFIEPPAVMRNHRLCKGIRHSLGREKRAHSPDFCTYGQNSGKKTEGSCESRMREHDHNEARKEKDIHQFLALRRSRLSFAYFPLANAKESKARCSRNPLKE